MEHSSISENLAADLSTSRTKNPERFQEKFKKEGTSHLTAIQLGQYSCYDFKQKKINMSSPSLESDGIRNQKDEEITVGPLDIQDYEACLDMAVNAFSTRNAIMMHLKVSPEELRDKFRKETQNSIDLCLSVKIKDPTLNGKDENRLLVGFLLCTQCDFMQPDSEQKPPSSSGLRAAFDVAEHLYLRASLTTSISLASIARGETLHVVCGGTAEGYEGRGLGTMLRSHLLSFAKERGFRRVLVEAVSPATIHIWTKLGYQLCGKLKVADFRGEKGSQPFKGIEPENTEYAIFEGVVDNDSSGALDRLCKVFWLSVILCKYRRWFKPYISTKNISAKE